MDDDYIPSDADAPDEVPESANLGLTGATADYDVLAEQSVVGSMLLNPSIIDDVVEALTPADFWQPKHETIARVIVQMHQSGAPVDAITVSEALMRDEKLLREAGGDLSYLYALTSIPSTSANAGYLAGLVHAKAVRRRITAAGHRIVGMGQSSEGELEDLVERARQELDAVPSGRRQQPRKVGEALRTVIGSLDEKPTYWRTPWDGLDKIVGGFSRGQLVIVAGRPGGGKTNALLQIAGRLAHEGVVAFSSLEMSEDELGMRLLSQYGPVSLRNLRDRTLTADDRTRVTEAYTAVKDAPLYIDYTGGASLGQIRAHARSVARGGNLVAIAVDYLQLVAGEGESREQRVAFVSRGLKQMAMDLNVVVVAAAQLRRGGLRRGATELPGMDDLRESGQIEQDADLIVLLHRDKKKKPGDLVMIVAKNRNGEAQRFTLDWQGHFSRMRDKPWTPYIEDDDVA